MKKLLSLSLIFAPLFTFSMDPSKFTPEQVEAFKRGEQIDEQEGAQWLSQNKGEIFDLLLNLSKVKEELKKQLGQEKYNALAAAWDMETADALARECVDKQRPFEFNKNVRALITDTYITTYLAK